MGHSGGRTPSAATAAGSISVRMTFARRADVLMCVVIAAFVGSCRPKYFYGLGFKSCRAELLWIDANSKTYNTQGPVALSKGQMSAEDAITVAIPEEIKLTWWTNGQPPRSATYKVARRLPKDFDTRRDTLWFVACPHADPMLVAEIGSREKGFALLQLSDGRRWSGRSIYHACEICGGRVSEKH